MALALTQNGVDIKVQRCPAPVRFTPVPLVINGESHEGKMTKWKDNTYTYFTVGGNDFYVEGPLTPDPITFTVPEGLKPSIAKNRVVAYEGLKAKRDAAKANGEAPEPKPRGRRKAKGDAEAQAQAEQQWAQ